MSSQRSSHTPGKHFFTLIFIATAGLLLTACASSSPVVAQPSAAGLEQDFSGGTCPFGRMQAGSSRGFECADGEFRAWIDNNGEAYDFITAPLGERFTDVSIEVDARFVSGEDAGAYIVCRGSQLTGNFYYFRLGVDGAVEITDYLEGEEQIARMKLLPEIVIASGWNHLRADCIGDTLSFYVNGELVLERTMEGDVYESGDIGLGAGGGSLGFSEVRFDNLAITKP